MTARTLTVEEVCRVMELPRKDLLEPLTLANFKAIVRHQRRQLAKRHHPDQGGSAARMAAINEMADAVEALSALPADGPQPFVIRVPRTPARPPFDLPSVAELLRTQRRKRTHQHIHPMEELLRREAQRWAKIYGVPDAWRHIVGYPDDVA
jgi:hypothetical protein